MYKVPIPMMHHVEKLIDTCFAYFPQPQPDMKKHANIRLVAHRGAHDNQLKIEENTLAAFDRAQDLGCYGIEFDVHACADGVLVVNHDATLKRLWGHDVAINTLRFEELRRLAPMVPTLEEIIANYSKRMHLFIELKSPFTATHSLAHTLRDLTPCLDYHLISLDENIFPLLHLFPKESMLLVSFYNNVSQFCKLSLQQRYGGVLGHYLLLQNKQIQQLLHANQMAGVGIVDSKYSLYRELNRGLSLLFSNKAATIATLLDELQK